MASFLNIIHLSVFFLIVLISASSSDAVTNVMFTGQTFSKQTGLSYAGTGISLIMQYDCNLVTYDGRGNAMWHTNTAGWGSRNCILSFTDNGRLVVRNPRGTQMWISNNANSKNGKYAAVLRPNGQVNIFGPAVWSFPVCKETMSSSSSNNSVEMVENLKNSASVYNLLFSGQVLYGNGKISDGEYSLIMKDDCELAVKKGYKEVLWSTSWTKGKGKNCFVRLNFKGVLGLRDDSYNDLWTSWVAWKAPVGEYVLIMQKNGSAVIYGPKVWTNTDQRRGLIKMPVAME